MNLSLDVARCCGWVCWADEQRCEMRARCARFLQAEREREDLLAESMLPADFRRRVVIASCYADGEPTAFLEEVA